MAARATRRTGDEPAEGTPTSVYFPDGDLLERIDALASETGLSRNKIINKILADHFPSYRRKPALLLGPA